MSLLINENERPAVVGLGWSFLHELVHVGFKKGAYQIMSGVPAEDHAFRVTEVRI